MKFEIEDTVYVPNAENLTVEKYEIMDIVDVSGFSELSETVRYHLIAPNREDIYCSAKNMFKTEKAAWKDIQKSFTNMINDLEKQIKHEQELIEGYRKEIQKIEEEHL